MKFITVLRNNSDNVKYFFTQQHCHHQDSSAPVSAGNTFQDLPRLHKTTDNTKRDIRVIYINIVKFNW
jgi:hypothetical protein